MSTRCGSGCIKRERNYGIDLLRLVLMFMVCVLHTLGQGGILNVCEAGSLNHIVYWFLETLAYCAVDGFAIISGYMASDKPRKFEKLADMWFQAFFYSLVLTLILTIAGFNANWGKLDVVKCVFPVTFGKFWYFTAYFALFFAIPALNRFVFGIDETTAKKALIILVVLYSFIGIVTDPFKTQGGYSALWLMILYCIGALAKRVRLFEARKSITLIVWWMGSILFSWAVLVIFKIGRLINYVSPTVLLSAMIMVILFSRLKIKRTAQIISKLSPLAFGIYLFQSNQIIWNVILKDAFVFVAEQNIILGVICVFAFALLIFISGLVVEFIRSKLAVCLRIPSLSRKIVHAADILLDKLTVLLK